MLFSRREPVLESNLALPSPLDTGGGPKVTRPSEWQAQRKRLLAPLLEYEYGHTPPAPGGIEAVEGPVAENGARLVTLRFGPEQRLSTQVKLYLPDEPDQPVPAVLRIGHHEQAAGLVLARGFAFCTFEHRDLEPEKEGEQFAGPCQQAYPDYDWGCLAAWAWGASRVLDWLKTVPEIAGDKVAVTGHSRTGKAALLAGALDERFAVVAPNGSGCGGAAVYRVRSKKAETLELITRSDRFKAWFQPDFGRFAGREGELPFDQHWLRALVAPRGVISTDATGDHWANPIGTQAGWQAAQAVFDLLDAPRCNALHFRRGGHAHEAEDYQVMLDFCAWYFAQGEYPESVNKPPFPEFTPQIRD